ncbi:hypothetical protein [Novosphingobium sp.]|uniref:hypothetical protein n=1 Tax=Novosphingobium sp. TaxID=1874826 RepID=UPI00261C0808|nr:hypothetical protein [Novosphingobium sp.]
MTEPRSCAVCGCTEATACTDELTGACWWVGERLCSHCAQPDARRRLALVAAAQLSEVVAELLRFTREGDQESFAPFALDPAENTADALRAILRIERAAMPTPGTLDPDEHGQLIAALARFLEGWA